ncbi:MAG: PadR family transcriptional regulator [Actinomycetota bacterium]|nr:PadR family transcriptional regulator [Actinomycetota bacterium]
MLEDPTADWYGLEVARQAGLPTGTIYPILARLEGARWLESTWEQVDPSNVGRPRRRLYRLTPHGVTAGRDALEAHLARIAPRSGASWKPTPRNQLT